MRVDRERPTNENRPDDVGPVSFGLSFASIVSNFHSVDRHVLVSRRRLSAPSA